jgi:hypothetical protein
MIDLNIFKINKFPTRINNALSHNMVDMIKELSNKAASDNTGDSRAIAEKVKRSKNRYKLKKRYHNELQNALVL